MESIQSTERNTTRRDFIRAGGVAAATLALPLSLGRSAIVRAQDNQIVSTKLGEVPTSGLVRPGPVGSEPAVTAAATGVNPVSIEINDIGINAQVETIEIVNGVMQDPTGPWVVSWYKETAKLGEIGNTVMAGHLDYWDVGPAVFYNVGQLKKDEKIQVQGDDGKTYVYDVDWVKLYDANNAPIQDIVGPTETESLTLITCGGPFD
jgi:hypothetical protein